MPNMALGGYGNQCSFPQCTSPKYYDPANGRVHDFCGRSHAYQARMQGTVVVCVVALGISQVVPQIEVVVAIVLLHCIRSA